MEHKCFNCGYNFVIWNNDFTFEDYDIEGEGVVRHFSCPQCMSEIVYYIPFNENNNLDKEIL